MNSDELEAKAIKFIHTVRDSMEGILYAGNSGGKDSAVVDYLLQKSGIEYVSIYNNTTIDPAGTISHIRHNYPHTQIIHPEKSFYELVEKKGLPTRLRRYCCDHLKERTSIGKNMFEGIRSAESAGRKNRDYIQCDTRVSHKGTQHIYPIYDWTDADVWQFIEDRNIILAPVYDKGFNRLGCVGCPLVSRKGAREAEFAAYPRVYERIKKAITKGMVNNPQWKLSLACESDGDTAMKWWLSGKTMDEYFTDYDFTKTGKVWTKVLRA